MVTLKRRNHELLEQQHESEAAFAQQRAKFMELFKQKEGHNFELFTAMVFASCITLENLSCSNQLSMYAWFWQVLTK